MDCPRCANPIDDVAARFCPFCGAGVTRPPEAGAGAAAEPVSSSAARCAIHPERSAVWLCARCGAFACAQCSQGGSDLCPACRKRIGAGAAFPLHRDRWSMNELLDLAWRRFKVDWPMLSVASLFVVGIGFGVGAVSQVVQAIALSSPSAKDHPVGAGLAVGFAAVLTMIVQIPAQGALQLGLIRLCFESLQGRPVELGRLFGQLRKVGKLILQALAMSVAVGVPVVVYTGLVLLLVWLAGGFQEASRAAIVAVPAALIGIAPLIYWLIPFYFMQMELACNDDVGPVDSIRNSFAIARGHRMVILGVAIVAGLIAIAGIFAFCIGIVPSMALGQLVMVGLYLTLRSGSDLPPLRLEEG